jgi:hypothetical protein
MSQPIHEAPHGINLVIETKSGKVILGRFDSADAFQVHMHDCDIHQPASGVDPESYIRETATYGVDVKERDYSFPLAQVLRWRRLGDIPKLI